MGFFNRLLKRQAEPAPVERDAPAPGIEAERPAFPEPFRDSPEVAAGVDFVAGASEMKLEGRILPSGEAVWVTYNWDQERSTSFAV